MQVGVVGETALLTTNALRWCRDQMAQTEEGARVLRLKPRVRFGARLEYAASNGVGVGALSVPVLSPEFLHSLPSESFGRAYGEYMSSHGYSPDERSDVRFIANSVRQQRTLISC
jgi:ubiquinone biosynthesis protein Coq4